MQQSGVYLIHFSPAYKHAKHYTGYAKDINHRIAEHQKGAGARLCEVAVGAGCQVILARVWPGTDRHFERKLKKPQKCAPALPHLRRRT